MDVIIHRHHFVQYFLKVADDDVEKYLKLFTFLPRNTIDQIVETHRVGSLKFHKHRVDKAGRSLSQSLPLKNGLHKDS
jgi:tyrosyl-tRNA synthetase